MFQETGRHPLRMQVSYFLQLQRRLTVVSMAVAFRQPAQVCLASNHLFDPLGQEQEIPQQPLSCLHRDAPFEKRQFGCETAYQNHLADGRFRADDADFRARVPQPVF